MLRFARVYFLAAMTVILLMPSLSSASVLPGLPGPFGGKILTSLPCFGAPGFFTVNIGEPLLFPPFYSVNTYILSMTSPFLSHTPPHPGQNVVGNAFGYFTCVVDPNPKHYIQLIDPVSVFYGTSFGLPMGSESAGANSVLNGHGLY